MAFDGAALNPAVIHMFIVCETSKSRGGTLKTPISKISQALGGTDAGELSFCCTGGSR